MQQTSGRGRQRPSSGAASVQRVRGQRVGAYELLNPIEAPRPGAALWTAALWAARRILPPTLPPIGREPDENRTTPPTRQSRVKVATARLARHRNSRGEDRAGGAKVTHIDSLHRRAGVRSCIVALLDAAVRRFAVVAELVKLRPPSND